MKNLEAITEKVETRDIPEEIILKISELRKKISETNFMKQDDFYPELFELINNLTKRNPEDVGMFLDKRNVNHVLDAVHSVEHIFHKDEKIDLKRLAQNFVGNAYFHYSIFGNPFISFDKNVLIIFSPENKLLKRILKKYLLIYRKDLDLRNGEGIEKFIEGEEQTVEGITTYDWGKILFNLFKYKNSHYQPRWSQIASCIVDLNKKKVYFFNK